MTQIDSIRQLYRLADKLVLEGYESDLLPGYRFMAFERAAKEIRLASNALQRISESECNGIERYDSKARMRLASWTDSDQLSADRRRAKHEARIIDALSCLLGPWLFNRAIQLEFQRDPRGSMLQVNIVQRSGPEFVIHGVAYW